MRATIYTSNTQNLPGNCTYCHRAVSALAPRWGGPGRRGRGRAVAEATSERASERGSSNRYRETLRHNRTRRTALKVSYGRRPRQVDGATQFLRHWANAVQILSSFCDSCEKVLLLRRRREPLSGTPSPPSHCRAVLRPCVRAGEGGGRGRGRRRGRRRAVRGA